MKSLLLVSLFFVSTASADIFECGGTEPFWSLRYNSNTTKVALSKDASRESIHEAVSDVSSLNHTGRRLVKATDNLNFWLLQQEEGTACSDGMSDTEYEYEIVIDDNGTALVGCCKKR